MVDFAYVAEQLAIEADGYRWHAGRARFERDRARRNALTLLGWHVIHVTWHDLSAQPDAVIAAIRTMLRTRDATPARSADEDRGAP